MDVWTCGHAALSLCQIASPNIQSDFLSGECDEKASLSLKAYIWLNIKNSDYGKSKKKKAGLEVRAKTT